MNFTPKRGKYSLAETDNEQQCSTTTKLNDGWKQCDYVSNRTRLRCQNVLSTDHLKDYGFCEEHQGYIERIKNEGLRIKHLFDPSSSISQSFMDLLSDEDETLEPRFSADFPFVYESLYCDSRFDNDENPLRSAKVYTKKEIIREYIRALKRQHQSIQEIRTVYQEKYLRVLQQMARLSNQSNPILLDPVKDTEKIQRMMAMRRSALNYKKQQIMRKKFSKMSSDTPATSFSIPTPLPAPIEEILNILRQTIEEDKIEEEKKKVSEQMMATTKTEAQEIIVRKTIEEEQIDEEMKDSEQIKMATKTEAHKTSNNNLNKLPPMSDNTMVCARINKPWNGTRRLTTPTHKLSPFNLNASSSSITNKINHQQQQLVRNNGFMSLPSQQSKQPFLMPAPKMPSAIPAINGGSSAGTYQQYLSQQRLIPAILQPSTARRNQTMASSRRWMYGTPSPSYQKTNAYK